MATALLGMATVAPDADGVLFASVQALHQLVQEKEARIRVLESKLSEMANLSARLAAVVGVSQSNAKTVLAYSSISQMGLITLGIGVGLAAAPSWVRARVAACLGWRAGPDGSDDTGLAQFV